MPTPAQIENARHILEFFVANDSNESFEKEWDSINQLYQVYNQYFVPLANCTDVWEMNPLAKRIKLGHLEGVKLLVEAKPPLQIDPQPTKEQSKTYMHQAATCWRGCVGIMQYLHTCGLFYDERDEHGDTPLHYAAKQLNFEAFIFLASQQLESDSDPRNFAGETPMDIIAKGEFEDREKYNNFKEILLKHFITLEQKSVTPEGFSNLLLSAENNFSKAICFEKNGKKFYSPIILTSSQFQDFSNSHNWSNPSSPVIKKRRLITRVTPSKRQKIEHKKEQKSLPNNGKAKMSDEVIDLTDSTSDDLFESKTEAKVQTHSWGNTQNEVTIFSFHEKASFSTTAMELTTHPASSVSQTEETKTTSNQTLPKTVIVPSKKARSVYDKHQKLAKQKKQHQSSALVANESSSNAEPELSNFPLNSTDQLSLQIQPRSKTGRFISINSQLQPQRKKGRSISKKSNNTPQVQSSSSSQKDLEDKLTIIGSSNSNQASDQMGKDTSSMDESVNMTAMETTEFQSSSSLSIPLSEESTTGANQTLPKTDFVLSKTPRSATHKPPQHVKQNNPYQIFYPAKASLDNAEPELSNFSLSFTDQPLFPRRPRRTKERSVAKSSNNLPPIQSNSSSQKSTEEKKQDEFFPVVKKEALSLEEMAQQSMHPLSKEEILTRIKILRGENNCQTNCCILVSDLLESFITGKILTKPSRTKTKPEDSLFYPVIQPVKIKQEGSEPKEVAQILGSKTKIFGKGEGASSNIPAQEAVYEDKQGVVNPEIFAFDCTQHQKIPIHFTQLNDSLKKLAGDKVIFGSIGLGGADKKVREGGHELVFYGTKDSMLYIECHKFNGKTKLGNPFLDNLTDDYRFVSSVPSGPNNKMGVYGVYSDHCFVIVYGEALVNPVKLTNDNHLRLAMA